MAEPWRYVSQVPWCWHRYEVRTQPDQRSAVNAGTRPPRAASKHVGSQTQQSYSETLLAIMKPPVLYLGSFRAVSLVSIDLTASMTGVSVWLEGPRECLPGCSKS